MDARRITRRVKMGRKALLLMLMDHLPLNETNSALGYGNYRASALLSGGCQCTMARSVGYCKTQGEGGGGMQELRGEVQALCAGGGVGDVCLAL